MNHLPIDYKSIIMRCDNIRHQAYKNLPESAQLEFYHTGMESVWKDIQKASGEFSSKSDKEILDYFRNRFCQNIPLLEKRCLFLKNKYTNQYIGTCMAWESMKDNQEIPILHWLAVSRQFSGRGFARILITQILQLFETYYPGRAIYLHTQPSSFAAIKLYHDFGFNICQKDTYGTAVNQFEDAVNILKDIMFEDEFKELINDSVI
ncbi:MAG: N-acetyltransferase [Anaerostipes faecalis]|nr:N-acetyltransferase [Anaerostipes faecalis]